MHVLSNLSVAYAGLQHISDMTLSNINKPPSSSQ